MTAKHSMQHCDIAKKRPVRVCVVTSLQAVQEPRAPRHAAWLAGLGADVVFVDSAPYGVERRPVKALEGFSNLTWLTHQYATRASRPLRLALDRALQRLQQFLFACTGKVSAGALSTRAFGLERMLRRIEADFYLAHNAETLWPAYCAAQARGARCMFDSMEFHSDMGDGQSPLERKLTRKMERFVLPKCALVLASSAQVATALAEEYGIALPLALDNVPPVEESLPPKPVQGLALYWRNAVVGLGQRGLDEALVALTQLPGDVTLHLQGRMPADGGTELKARIAALGLVSRVNFHPPYAPEDAVKNAARHNVGLCLERRGCRNHELTVSNKIFDYHMAGLAVIASDLPGLRQVMERSGGGMLFTPGSAEDLAAKIRQLHGEPALLEKLAANARAFALREGNREAERKKFVAAFNEVCAREFGVR